MVHHSLSKFESIVIGGVSLPYQNLDIWKLRIWMIARGSGGDPHILVRAKE